jgi:hypothetical protein
MGEAEEIQALLRQLEQAPDNATLRGRAADALDAAGRRDEAMAILAPVVNITGHDDDTGLPCLCKACLSRSTETAEAAGMTFRRSFAVARNRVLYFWTPRELDRPGVRRSVSEALDQRLARKAK